MPLLSAKRRSAGGPFYGSLRWVAPLTAITAVASDEPPAFDLAVFLLAAATRGAR